MATCVEISADVVVKCQKRSFFGVCRDVNFAFVHKIEECHTQQVNFDVD